MKRLSFILMSSALAVLLAVDVTYFCGNSVALSHLNASSSSGGSSSSSSTSCSSCASGTDWREVIEFALPIAGKWLYEYCDDKRTNTPGKKQTYLKWKHWKKKTNKEYLADNNMWRQWYMNWRICTEETGSKDSDCTSKATRIDEADTFEDIF